VSAHSIAGELKAADSSEWQRRCESPLFRASAGVSCGKTKALFEVDPCDGNGKPIQRPPPYERFLAEELCASYSKFARGSSFANNPRLQKSTPQPGIPHRSAKY
jgi:hypothetical protein